MKPTLNRPRNNFPGVLAAALLAAALAVSCWHPVFDWMLVESEITVKKLGEPKLYFTADVYEGYDTNNYWFLPQIAQMPTYGLLITEMDERIGIKSFPSIDQVNHQSYINPSSMLELNNTLGDAYMVLAAPDGFSAAFAVTNTINGQTIPMMDPNTGSSTVVPSSDTPNQFGIGAVAVAGSANVTLNCYSYQTMIPNYQIESPWTGGDPVFNVGIGNALIFSEAPGITAPGRLLDTTGSTNYLYLSCGLSDGTRAVYRWDTPPYTASTPTRYPEDYGPLIGALSDGRLLAQKDGIISVLGPDLNFLFKFPAGRLRFVHERYDNLIDFEMKVVFTRTVFVRNNSHDSDGQLLVELYEIPTAELEDLAD
jgi:hypothetical protein